MQMLMHLGRDNSNVNVAGVSTKVTKSSVLTLRDIA